MKRFSLFAFAAVAMLVVGCTKDVDTDVKVDDGIVRGELVTKQVVIEESRLERDEATGKLSWNEGDKVKVVLCNEGVYTLDTETYTVDHEANTVTIPSNAVLMIYPYTRLASVTEAGVATLNLLQGYENLTAPEEVFDRNVMKGVVDGDVVTFTNLMGYLKIPLTGKEETLNTLTVKSEIFSDGFKPLSRSATLDVTDANSNLEMVTTVSGSSNIYGTSWVYTTFTDGLDLSTSPAIYLPVPEGTYANLAIIAETDNGATTIYANNSHTVTRSKIKPVSSSAINVTSHTPSTPTLLSGLSGDSKMDYANTYIVPPTAGEYAFQAILADGTELEGGVTAEIVWAEEAGMFNDFHYDPSQKIISFKTNGKEGNALITLSKNDRTSTTIVWTWLLWCTDTPQVIKTVGIDSEEYYLMDRMLGATWAPTTEFEDQRATIDADATYPLNASVDATQASEACGVYYQYQNMIPYPRLKDINAQDEEDLSLTNSRCGVQYGFYKYQCWNSTAGYGTITTDDNGQYRSRASLYLGMFYASDSSIQWTGDLLIGNEDDDASTDPTTDGLATYRLWNSVTDAATVNLSVKTNQDPCPPGYMIDHYGGTSKNWTGTANNNRKGFVRNPASSEDYPIGYKFYGVYMNGCTDKNGNSVALYYPCCGYKDHLKTILSSNAGYVYTYNTHTTNSEVVYTHAATSLKYYRCSTIQYGDNNGAFLISGNRYGDIDGAYGRNVRCRKAGF